MLGPLAPRHVLGIGESQSAAFLVTYLNAVDRLAKVYGDADSEFPVPEGPGWIVRYAVEQIGGLGPWSPVRH